MLLRTAAEAKTLRAIWAERYNLPRNDPRYQDATDEDVIRDLLVAMYRTAERRRQDPLESQLDDVLRDPTGAAEAERAFEASLTETGTLGARIRAFERARQVEEPEPVSIRIRTARTPRS